MKYLAKFRWQKALSPQNFLNRKAEIISRLYYGVESQRATSNSTTTFVIIAPRVTEGA